MKHRSTLVVIALLAMLAVLWRTSPSSPLNAGPQGSVPKQAAAWTPLANVLTKNLPAIHWREGDHAAYRIRTVTTMTHGSEAGGTTQVLAQMHWTVASVTDSEVELLGICSVADYRWNGRRIPGYERLLCTEPVRLTLARDAEFKALRLRPEIAKEDREVFKMVHGWHFAIRPEASYAIEERTMDEGRVTFVAKYQLTADGIVKSRSVPRPHLDLQATEVGGSRQDILHSSFLGKPGHLWLTQLRGSEKSRLMLHGVEYGQAEASVELEELPLVAMPAALTTLSRQPANWARLVLSDDVTTTPELPSVTAALRQQQLREEWAGVPLEQVIAKLQTVAAGPMATVTQPLSQLVDWLTAFPERIPQLAGAIAQMQDPSVANLSVHALASVPDAAAVTALAKVLEEPSAYPAHVAAQAVLSVSDLNERADSRVLEALRGLGTSAADAGGYDLGDMAKRAYAKLVRDDPEYREAIRSSEAANLDVGANEQDKQLALQLFTIAGIEDERGEALVADPSPTVRGEASAYIAALPVTSARDATLVQLLDRDPDPIVRQAVAEALAKQGRPQSQAVAAALLRHQNLRN